MAQILQIDPDAVVGKLLRVWAWFDEQTQDGNAPSVTKALLDRYVGVTGFVTAMLQVGWLSEDDGGISIPNFNRHNGDTAKKRALTAKRVAESRGKTANVTQVYSNCNAPSVTSALPREEKIREREDKKKEFNTSCSESQATSKPNQPLTNFEFSVVGQPEPWKPTQDFVERLQATYETIDVEYQLRAASLWLDANRTKRKTAVGMNRFLVSWMNRATDNPRTPKKRQPVQPGEIDF